MNSKSYFIFYNFFEILTTIFFTNCHERRQLVFTQQFWSMIFFKTISDLPLTEHIIQPVKCQLLPPEVPWSGDQD